MSDIMIDNTDNTPRWRYRFDNFKNAYGLLSEAIILSKTQKLNALEQEGLIKRFEYTWELAWKTLKDYLESQGVILDTITPASTIRAAFASKIITNGDVWLQALDTRNKMSHTYNRQQFEHAILLIESNYIKLFDELHTVLLNAE
jgi:nucleotidyltransferase substrate binding protein (TIGR01987 family)